MLAKHLQATDSDASPQPSTFLLQGHPLFYRDRILHKWGIRTETEEVFIGKDLTKAQMGLTDPDSPRLDFRPSPKPKKPPHFQSDEDEARALGGNRIPKLSLTIRLKIVSMKRIVSITNKSRRMPPVSKERSTR